jgi:hypothetical protein
MCEWILGIVIVVAAIAVRIQRASTRFDRDEMTVKSWTEGRR